MSLYRVAIVGRPNVGKSSLLNMLAKAKVSIVDPTPGVTRDRVATVVQIPAPDGRGPTRVAEVIDTGGYGVYVAEGARFNEIGEDLASLTPQIEAQIGEAVRTSDLTLFVIDTQAGVTAADREIATMLREGSFGRKGRSGPKRKKGEAARGALPPVLAVANKVDDSSWEADAAEAASLGFGAPLVVSAATNYMRRDFLERLWAALPKRPRSVEEESGEEPALKIAIIGKRNAGKSTIVNALAGEERVIVSEIAGTTRDAVDVRFERDGRVFVAIDTAGFRKRKSFADQVEWWAYDRARRALLRADVAVFVLDATTPISQVDKQLGSEIVKAFKPCVIVVNKWDLAEGRKTPSGKPITTEDFQRYLDKELKGLGFCPIVFTSAAEGADEGRVWAALETARDLHEESGKRVGTGELNRAMRPLMERMPASKLGKKLKVLFASQIEVRPPTIVLVVNNPDLYTPQHERYVLNRIRETTPFGEVPVRLLVRGRRRDEAVQEGGEAPVSEHGVPLHASPMVEALDEEDFEGVDLSGGVRAGGDDDGGDEESGFDAGVFEGGEPESEDRAGDEAPRPAPRAPVKKKRGSKPLKPAKAGAQSEPRASHGAKPAAKTARSPRARQSENKRAPKPATRGGGRPSGGSSGKGGGRKR